MLLTTQQFTTLIKTYSDDSLQRTAEEIEADISRLERWRTIVRLEKKDRRG